jgi:predicted nucleotidyltransferase
MKTLEEIKAALMAHKQELRQQYHVGQIGIFGSCARREDTPISDVDILVELDQPVGWEIVDLHRFLEHLLYMKVDLVTKGAVIRKPLLWQSIQEDLIYV